MGQARSQTYILFLYIFIFMMVKSSMEINLNESEFNCLYIISNSSSSFEKEANIMQHIVSEQHACDGTLYSALERSARCLIKTNSRDGELLNTLSTIARHVILLHNMPCNGVPASAFHTEMYCREKEIIMEKYLVRGKIVRRAVSN
jgi:hypothetical protein